jgi:hypothetical protein
MEQREILELRVYYYDALMALGKYPIFMTPTIEKLKLSRGVMQRAYREIKERRLDVNLIEYLCYISTHYISREIESHYLFAMKDMSPSATKETKLRFYFDAIMHVRVSKKEEFNNMLRLCMTNPFYFFTTEASRSFKDSLELAKNDRVYAELLVYEFFSCLLFYEVVDMSGRGRTPFKSYSEFSELLMSLASKVFK